MAKNRRIGFVRTTSVSSASSTHYSYYNKTFEDVIDLFLFACTHGDYILVYRLLNSGEVQADVANKMGKTALQLAIENEHFEVVKALLDTIPYERFRDALLLAIYLGHNKIADFILNHPIYRTFEGGYLDPSNPEAYDDSQFSSDITPLILASQYNRLPIVHQLLIRGERIKKPHAYLCTCDECTTALASDPFRQAQVRLSAYKGLASDIYIALTSTDPILEAFQLRQELRRLAKVEHHFYKEYKKLTGQLSIFVARLLDNVRGQEELEIVLNKTGLPHEEKYATLARFDLAIQYREKLFVSHSNCQQKLMEKWYENLSIIKNSHVAKRLFFYLAYLISFPILSIIYYFIPQSKVGVLCQQPNLKFKAYIASYFIFMGLIIASSYVSAYHLGTTVFLSDYDNLTYTRYIEYIYQNDELKNDLINRMTDDGGNNTDTVLNCDISLRFMTPNLFQTIMFVWVIGFGFHELKQILSVGIRVYLLVPSNYVDSSMNLLYICYFIFLYIAMTFTRVSMNSFQSEKFWERIMHYGNMSDIDKHDCVSKTIHLLYWINADRFYWKNADLNYLAEGFFSMAHVVSICRICFLLPIIAFVGPLQVMLERLIVDLSKWIAFIILFFTAFACTLYFLYAPYNAILDSHETLTGIQSSTSNSSINQVNVTDSSFTQCPDLFFALINGTQMLPTNDDDITIDDNNDLSNDNSTDGFCQNAPDYSDLQKIGPYPAVYYFGRSSRATILTAFFTLFGNIATGGVPDRGYELITVSCYQPDPDSYLSTFDDFISTIGFILYGLFAFVCVTVLINTLIAMLEESIDQIDDRADIEWKFARSKLYMEYIRKGNVLPVPLNICPSPSSIMKVITKIQELFKKKSSKSRSRQVPPNIEHPRSSINETIRLSRTTTSQMKNSKSSFHNENIFNRKKNSLTTGRKLTYQIVIERIVKRFLLYYQNHQSLDEKEEAFEFKEIKQDISSLRFEISHEVDLIDDLCLEVIHTMKIFNESLNDQFPYQEIQLKTASE